MISATDLRPGAMVEFDGVLFKVTHYQHVKPGKGGGFVRLKLKNIELGTAAEKTLDSWVKIPVPDVEDKEMQYLYKQGEGYVFMDMESYEQITLSADDVDEAWKYLKEEMAVDILFFKGRPVSVELPITVDLKVTQSDPGIKGDRVSGATKPATLVTGAVIQVPLFINEGDVLKIDTRTGEYLERVNK